MPDRQPPSPVVPIESLESRLFLSAAPVVANLLGSYGGTFKTSLNASFPFTSGNPKLRPLTLKITSETAQGGLTGNASIGGLGNSTFTGFTTGGTFRLVFAGDSSGLITGIVSGKNVLLHGNLYAFVGTRQLSGTFTASPAASQSTATAALSFNAQAPARAIRLRPTVFGSTTNETLTFPGVPASLIGVIARNSTLAVTVNSQSSSGLIIGSLDLQGTGTIPFSGITAAGATTIVFSGSNVSGQIVAHPLYNTIGSGSFIANVRGTIVGASLRSQSSNAISSGPGSVPRTTNLVGNVPGSTSSIGSTSSVGSNTGAAGNIPISSPVNSVLGGTSTNSPFTAPISSSGGTAASLTGGLGSTNFSLTGNSSAAGSGLLTSTSGLGSTGFLGSTSAGLTSVVPGPTTTFSSGSNLATGSSFGTSTAGSLTV